MDRSEILTLIDIQYVTGDDGIQKRQSETKRNVYCNVSSISGTEWMDAGRNGIKPEYRFTMFEPDYNGELICEYKGVCYAVYRLYRGRNETMELYVKRKGGVQP